MRVVDETICEPSHRHPLQRRFRRARRIRTRPWFLLLG
jgi:hypothetical protein